MTSPISSDRYKLSEWIPTCIFRTIQLWSFPNIYQTIRRQHSAKNWFSRAPASQYHVAKLKVQNRCLSNLNSKNLNIWINDKLLNQKTNKWTIIWNCNNPVVETAISNSINTKASQRTRFTFSPICFLQPIVIGWNYTKLVNKVRWGLFGVTNCPFH